MTNRGGMAEKKYAPEQRRFLRREDKRARLQQRKQSASVGSLTGGTFETPGRVDSS